MIIRFLYFLIYLLEKLKKYDKKIIESIELDGYEVLTDNGFKPITHIHKTKPFEIYIIKTTNFVLKCADEHIVFDNMFNEVFVKDLKKGSYIQTKNGIEEVISIQKTTSKVCMFDVTVNSNEHRFYSNGILSHNTVVSGIYLVWFLLFNFDKNVLLLGNTGATAKEIIEKVKAILENLPFFLKPGILKKDVLQMKFDNGCRIIGRTTTKSAAIGFTIHLLYCDEFAHIQANIINSFWRSVYPTLSSSKISQVIITSTPNGMNLFYDIYNGAVEGLNTFKPLFVAWWQVPGRDAAWRLKEIQNLGGNEESFEQEYGCKFISGSGMLLDFENLAKIKKWINDYELKQIEVLDELDVDYGSLLFNADFDIEEIYDKSNYFLMSIDMGEGLQQDNTELNIYQFDLMEYEKAKKCKNIVNMIDYVILKQVGNYSSNNTTPDLFAAFLYDLVTSVFYSENLLIAIELNSAGAEVVRSLYNIYGDDNEFATTCFVKYPKSADSKRTDDGIYISPKNKQDLCKYFKTLLRDDKIVITDPKALNQLNNFGMNKKGSYQALTGKDDKVMANVIAGSAIKTKSFKEMAEDFLDGVDEKVLESYEDLIDEKLSKREKQMDDDYFW